MFTYDKGTGVLYTCDAFGMHYCSEVRRLACGRCCCACCGGSPAHLQTIMQDRPLLLCTGPL